MRLRTLTETLWEGEAYAQYGLYSKTATAYMFGHCASDENQFGSGFGIGGGGSGFRSGNPGSIFHNIGDGLQERFDWSGHDGLPAHLNIDLHKSSINIGPSHHIDLGFDKKIKW